MDVSVDFDVEIAHRFQIAAQSKVPGLFVSGCTGGLVSGVFTLTSVFMVTMNPAWNVPTTVPRRPAKLEKFPPSPTSFSHSSVLTL